jgi:hypothetical protein
MHGAGVDGAFPERLLGNGLFLRMVMMMVMTMTRSVMILVVATTIMSLMAVLSVLHPCLHLLHRICGVAYSCREGEPMTHIKKRREIAR